MAMRIAAVIFMEQQTADGTGPEPADGTGDCNALPVSARESAIIGALFFVGVAILFFIRPSDDEGH
jgi:hypothetical protein